jgi:peroxiredoxin
MMKCPHAIAAATVLALSLSFCRADGVKIGEAAPDFTLKDTNGKELKLSDYKGKYVVLEWVNYGCPFVKKHYESDNMQGLQKEYTGKGVTWFSVCSSAEGKQGYFTPEEWNKEMTERKVASTAVLLDGDGTVGKRYGAKTTPQMFIVNPDGNLIYQGAIDSKPSTDKDDIRSAKNYVKSALEEAMAGKSVSHPNTESYGCGVKYQ